MARLWHEHAQIRLMQLPSTNIQPLVSSFYLLSEIRGIDIP